MTASGASSGVLVEATTGFEPVNRGFADLGREIIGAVAERDEPDLDGLEPNGSGVRSGVERQHRRATLYRYFGDHGELLYVGKTGTGRKRSSGHIREADWWQFVAYAEFFHHEQWAVDLAERFAIWQERPLYNIVLRVSTKERHAMLEALGPHRPGYLVGWSKAASVLRMSPDDVGSAVWLGFLRSERPRALCFEHAELVRFIGDADDGPRAYPLPPFRPDHLNSREWLSRHLQHTWHRGPCCIDRSVDSE